MLAVGWRWQSELRSQLPFRLPLHASLIIDNTLAWIIPVYRLSLFSRRTLTEDHSHANHQKEAKEATDATVTTMVASPTVQGRAGRLSRVACRRHPASYGQL
ncbi:hypothetical protein ARMGADRAFT_573784 [Armillaria gallica]|uniref:Uncharacterized protein n=1 Tax=Armillaria gallica TaxID=47427 RepID=A0A2H3E596_ARMGA|nr:hypothetical protein ARMGADRAFT_573784 [Armillaria gallica]